MSDEVQERRPWGAVPEDPIRYARWHAIRLCGGTNKVGKAMGFKHGEAVRRWYVDRDPSPEQARKLVALCGYAVTLREILPGAYGNPRLTVLELGYTPREGKRPAS